MKLKDIPNEVWAITRKEVIDKYLKYYAIKGTHRTYPVLFELREHFSYFSSEIRGIWGIKKENLPYKLDEFGNKIPDYGPETEVELLYEYKLSKFIESSPNERERTTV